MNSVSDEPRPAKLHLDSITQLMAQFEGAIAPELYRGCVGHAAGFGVIGLGAHHGRR